MKRNVTISIALIIGLTASIIGLIGTIPQVVRARRTTVEGISWTSQLLTLATCTLWAIYGLFILDGIQIFNNVIALSLNGLLVAAIVAACPHTRPTQAIAVIAATAVAAALIAWMIAPLVVGMIGSVIGAVRLIPQLSLAFSGQPLWGLDPWAVQLTLGSSGIWLAYGLAVTDLAVISSAGLAVAMNAAICARRLPPRRTLRSIADGRVGPRAARYATPVAALVRAPANTAGHATTASAATAALVA